MPRFAVAFCVVLACAAASAAPDDARHATRRAIPDAPDAGVRLASHEATPARDAGGPRSSAIPLGRRHPSASMPLPRPGDEPSVPWPPGRGSALLTALGSLALVLALFLGVTWMLRRGVPAGARTLPRDVLEVLGRSPLPGRQNVHLIRVGHKLILVWSAGGGVETLTEINDPLEVDRLTGLCQQARPGSATSSFRQIFQQLGGEKTGVSERDALTAPHHAPIAGPRRSPALARAEDDDV